jgi:hypothetical protein
VGKRIAVGSTATLPQVSSQVVEIAGRVVESR